MIEKKETYTNIAYFLSGLAGYITFGNMMFFMVMTLLSVGSFIYHKYLKGEIYTFDWYAMVVVISTMSGILIDNQIYWMAVICYQFVYGFFIMGRLGVYIEIGLASIALIVALFLTITWYYACFIILAFVIALWVRSLDEHKNYREVFYDSKPHSVWHIITAIGFYLILYYNDTARI